MLHHLNELRAAQFIGRWQAVAAQEGIKIEISNDFKLLADEIARTPERSVLTPIFDINHCVIDPDKAFWVGGWNETGELIHTQALRVDDLHDESLYDFLQQHRFEMMTPTIPSKPELGDFGLCPYNHELTGKLCYHGEMWLSPQGMRGKGLAVTLPRVAMVIAQMRWAPDYIYGFVKTDLVYKGIPARYGYYHMAPGGMRWPHPSGDGSFFDEWLVWANPRDIDNLIAVM